MLEDTGIIVYTLPCTVTHTGLIPQTNLGVNKDTKYMWGKQLGSGHGLRQN